MGGYKDVGERQEEKGWWVADTSVDTLRRSLRCGALWGQGLIPAVSCFGHELVLNLFSMARDFCICFPANYLAFVTLFVC